MSIKDDPKRQERVADRNRRLLFSFLTLATGWRLFIFFDHSFWRAFVHGNDPEKAWLYYIIPLYVALLAGAWIITMKNVKAFSLACLSASLALSIAIRAAYRFQVPYAAYSLLGASTGGYFVSFAFFAGLGVMPEERISFNALVALGFSGIICLFSYLFEWLPFDIAFFLLCLVQGAAIVLGMRYTLSPPAEWSRSSRSAIDYRPFFACALVLGVGYFVSYLNAGGSSFGDFAFASAGSLWLDFVVRGSACLLVFFLGRRIRISQLLYATVFAYVLALLMLMLRLEAEAVAFIAIDIAFILGQITFYVLFTALVYKFGSRPAIFGFLSLCVGLGVVGGHGAGRSLSSVLAGYPTHLLVVSLILANTIFFALSFLLRSTMREIDLERENSPGLYRLTSAKSGEASGESASIALRRDVARALLALNERFDPQYRLTNRELQVAAYCVERYDYATIAEKMGITLNTLKTHVRNIYQKYDIRGRKDLAELLENSLRPEDSRTP